MKKLTKQDLESFLRDFIERAFEAYWLMERSDKPKYPEIEFWRGPNEQFDGVYLTQGRDEVWLTEKQALKLIKDLQEIFTPENGDK